MKHYFVGVDIGTSNIVMVVGSRTDDSVLFNIEGISVQQSRKSVIDGVITNIEIVGDAIKNAKYELESELGIKIEQVYVGIGNVYTRSVSVTDWAPVKNKKSGKIGKEDIIILEQLLKMVKTENRAETIREILPLAYYINGEQRTLDPVGKFGSWLKADYLFSIGISDHIRLIKMACVKAGLELLNIFVNPMVTYPLLVSDKEANNGVAIVDIGGGVTDITIVKEGRVQYFVSIPIGAEAIDNDLKTILPSNSNISSVKHKYGKAIASSVADNEVVPVGGKEIICRNIATVIEARLIDIAELVMGEIKSAGFEQAIESGFVLTGGSVDLDGIDALFERETGRQSRKADMLYGLCEQAKSCDITFGQQTAVAVMMNAANFAPTNVIEVGVAAPKVIATPIIPEPAEPKSPETKEESAEKVEIANNPNPEEGKQPDKSKAVEEPKKKKKSSHSFGSILMGLMGYGDHDKK